MAKDKKNKKAKADGKPVELFAGPEPAPKGKSKKKSRDGGHGAMDALSKLAEHPLVSDLIAVGALAAVAAIAESGRADPASVKSARAAKTAGKAAAAAIGARLLKEFAAHEAKKDSKA